MPTKKPSHTTHAEDDEILKQHIVDALDHSVNNIDQHTAKRIARVREQVLYVKEVDPWYKPSRVATVGVILFVLFVIPIITITPNLNPASEQLTPEDILFDVDPDMLLTMDMLSIIGDEDDAI